MATYIKGSGYTLQPFISGGKMIDAFSLPNSGNVDPYTGKQLAIITTFTTIAGGSTTGSPRAGIWESPSQRWGTTPITLNNTAESSTSAVQTFNLTLNTVLHTGATYYGGIYAAGGLAMKRNTSTGSFNAYNTTAGGNENNGYTSTTVSSTWNPANLYFQLTYYRLPNAPAGTPSVSVSGTNVTLTWTAATVPDSGGAGDVTGYKIQVSYDSGSTWSTWIENTGSTSTGAVNISTGDGGATFKAGQTVRFRVAAKNGVCIDWTPVATANLSTYYNQGVYGSTLSSGPYGTASADVTIPGGIYNGTTWKPFSNMKVYNGTSFVTPTTFKIYDGSTWKSLI